MSLDVWLKIPPASTGDPVNKTNVNSGIFVREDGQTLEITREEWDRKYPGREPVVALSEAGRHMHSYTPDSLAVG